MSSVLDVDGDNERTGGQEADRPVVFHAEVLAADVEAPAFSEQPLASHDCQAIESALKEKHSLVHTSRTLSLSVDFDHVQTPFKTVNSRMGKADRLQYDWRKIHAHSRTPDDQEDVNDRLELQREVSVVSFREISERLALLVARRSSLFPDSFERSARYRGSSSIHSWVSDRTQSGLVSLGAASEEGVSAPCSSSYRNVVAQ